MADPDQRQFASDFRNARANPRAPVQEAEPEWKRAAIPRNQPMGKRTNLTIKQQRESLPVFAFRSALIKAVHENQFLIVVGETGSGKTTQLTQYLDEAGFTDHGISMITTEELIGEAFAALRAGASEIRPGQSKQLAFMRRLAPGFINRQLWKASKAMVPAAAK